MSAGKVVSYIQNRNFELFSDSKVVGMLYGTDIDLFSILMYYIENGYLFIRNSPKLQKISIKFCVSSYTLMNNKGQWFSDLVTSSYKDFRIMTDDYCYVLFNPVNWDEADINTLKHSCELENISESSVKVIPKYLSCREDLTIKDFIYRMIYDVVYTDIFDTDSCFEIVDNIDKTISNRLLHAYLYYVIYKNRDFTTLPSTFMKYIMTTNKKIEIYSDLYKTALSNVLIKYGIDKKILNHLHSHNEGSEKE